MTNKIIMETYREFRDNKVNFIEEDGDVFFNCSDEYCGDCVFNSSSSKYTNGYYFCGDGPISKGRLRDKQFSVLADWYVNEGCEL